MLSHNLATTKINYPKLTQRQFDTMTKPSIKKTKQALATPKHCQAPSACRAQ